MYSRRTLKLSEIRKRGDSYQISVFLGRDRKTQKKLYERTTYTPEATTEKAIEKEVKSFADEFEKRVKDGDVFSGEKMTFAEYVEIWKTYGLAKKTECQREKIEYAIDTFFIPSLGHLKLSKIKATHIDKIIEARVKSGKAPSTVRHTFEAISQCMQYAFKKGYIKENPCLRCDDLPPENKDNQLHYFTVEQAKTFLNALTLDYSVEKNPVERKMKSGKSCKISGYTANYKIPFQWRVYFNISIYGGFRRGEIVSLTWEDIDFEKNSISITKSIARPKSGEHVKGTKTKSSEREIILPQETFTLLREWKVRQRELCLGLGTVWRGFRGDDFDKNFIFIDLTSGERMSVNTPTHKFREILELYNSHYAEKEEDKLPRIRLHDLRHTSATLLLANGTDIETVSKRLGHSRASITLDVYGHAMKKCDKTASDTLERLFA